MTGTVRTTILMIGNDTTLTYLIGRYAETSGYQIQAMPTPPTIAEIRAVQPAAIIFPSIENLESARTLVAELTNVDIPLLVCVSAADEARAHELGADYGLLHPLTYEQFVAVLDASIHSEEE